MVLELIQDMEKALQNECYLGALMIALTLPDICGKAEYPKEKTTLRYIHWYNEYVGKYDIASDDDIQMPHLSGEVVNSLRNFIFHQGTPDINYSKQQPDHKKIEKFVLQITETNGIYSDACCENVFTDGCIYYANIGRLCFIIGKSAKGYYYKNQDKFDFINYKIQDMRIIMKGR